MYKRENRIKNIFKSFYHCDRKTTSNEYLFYELKNAITLYNKLKKLIRQMNNMSVTITNVNVDSTT